MKSLFEFFPPNFLAGAVVKHYELGDEFTLNNRIGVVVEGVVAVDVIGQHTEDFITLRLTTFGDVLNLERIVNNSPPAYHYVCESTKASVAMIDISRFDNELRNKSAEVQNVITQSILSQLLRHGADLVDTITAVGRSSAKDQVIWAVQRFTSLHGQKSGMPARSERIASHIGVRPETASRTVSKLCEEGILNRDAKTKTLTLNSL